MKSFFLALQFLTIIPLKLEKFKEQDLAESSKYFPLVGLLLGLILAGAHRLLLLLNFDPFSINISVVVLLVALTGALHLDGLADTTDAFLSRKNKDEMLQIMRDPHIGVMGTLSLLCIILLKIAFFSSIDAALKTTALLLMCSTSRWTLVLSMFLSSYARHEGKAKVFMQGMNLKIFIIATIFTLAICVLIYQLKGFIILLVIALLAFWVNSFLNSKIDGVSGDTLGAVNELMELAILFSLGLLAKINMWAIFKIF
ncbi:MAG: adenosylcobinamide-GDP ribazoletransferase [Elusimicrobia bacterium]|nr:adenosylcobinamide-GDP ribazoletransferase [Elusimicrobiota bacterium]